MTDHLKAWEAYAAARIRKEQTSAVAKEAEAKFRKAEQELADAMLEDDVQSWKDSSGATVARRQTFDVAVNQSNMEEVEKWLYDRFGDATPFKKTVLDKWAVRDRVRSLIDDEGVLIDELPSELGAKYRYGITVGGWEKKSEELA